MKFVVRLSKAKKGDESLLIIATDIKGKDKILATHDDPSEASEHLKRFKKQYGNDVKIRVEKRGFTKKEWKPNARGKYSEAL